MQNHPGQEVTILLIEDDEIDAAAIQRAFRRQKIANHFVVVGDGLEGLEVLRAPAEESGVTRPYLILLDLNMPRMNGIEFLEELRADEELRNSIVFVLTTSDDEQDKLQAWDHFIAGYLVKAKVGEDFISLINMLDNYWRVVEFPPIRTTS